MYRIIVVIQCLISRYSMCMILCILMHVDRVEKLSQVDFSCSNNKVRFLTLLSLSLPQVGNMVCSLTSDGPANREVRMATKPLESLKRQVN